MKKKETKVKEKTTEVNKKRNKVSEKIFGNKEKRSPEKEKKSKNKESKSKISNSVKFTILAIILIIIFCISITPVTMQNDTYYTIKVGEHIDKYGIDNQDQFSWHQDLSYTYPHWGYDLITYYIYSTFGMTGIYVTTCILACILGLAIYLINTKLCKNQVISFLITIGAMYLIRSYITARAQLVTFILFILTIYFIEKFIETRTKRYAIGLIIIPIIIANVHVAVFPFYFVLYLPYIAEYIIAILGEIVFYKKYKIKLLKRKIKKSEKKGNNQEKIEILQAQLKQTEEKSDKIKIRRSKELRNPYKIKLEKRNNVKWLIIIMIICIFTGFLTPLGTTPYTYLIKTMEGNTTQNINEHLPMTITNEKEVMCALAIFLIILLFTKTKIRLTDLFMLCGLTYLMLSARRQVAIFGIICSVILNRIIMNFSETYKFNIQEKALKIITGKIGIILITIIMLIFSWYMIKDKLDDTFIDETAYPVKACDFILENIDLGEARFYNEYNYGSYMLFRGIPVFIDSRADLYAPEFNGKNEDIFSDFINTSGIGTFYEDTFEKYNITHIITYENSKMNMIITKTNDPKCKLLYKDDYFAVYERVNTEE